MSSDHRRRLPCHLTTGGGAVELQAEGGWRMPAPALCWHGIRRAEPHAQPRWNPPHLPQVRGPSLKEGSQYVLGFYNSDYER